MFTINDDKKSRITCASGINNTHSCTFNALGTSAIDGGAIYCTSSGARLIVSECSFNSCIGKSGGAIFASTSIATFNTNGYGFFAIVAAASSVLVSLLTMSKNSGIASSAKLESSKQTLISINSTENKGTQE